MVFNVSKKCQNKRKAMFNVWKDSRISKQTKQYSELSYKDNLVGALGKFFRNWERYHKVTVWNSDRAMADWAWNINFHLTG